MKKKLSNDKQNYLNNAQQRNNNQGADYQQNEPDMSLDPNSSKYYDKDNEDM